MQPAHIATPPANENAPSLRLELLVTDPEVAHELAQREEGTERDTFAKHALRIGVLALRHANGALDTQTIQREGERMLSSVREALSAHATDTRTAVAQLLGKYLDPCAGSLPQRLDRLTKRDGELESLLSKHLDGERSTVAQTLARQVGLDSPIVKLLSPTQAGGVVATLSQTIEGALGAQRDELLRQFSLDRPDSALSRLVSDLTMANGKLRGELSGDVAAMTRALSFDNAEGPLSLFASRVEKAQRSILEQLARSLTLDDKASPLSLLRGELMAAVAALAESNAQFQSDVRAKIEAFRVRREEAARSSAHGHSFEYAAGELLQLEASAAGDVCARLSGTPGREGRKTGDFVLTLGPESAASGAKIVFECKAEKGYTEAEALDELALARKNREAEVGVFIVARESAKEGFLPFRRVGNDVLVIWDSEDPGTDVYVKAAVSIARALVVEQHRASDRSEADMRGVEQSIRAIERLVTAVESIAHDARNVAKKGAKIGKAAEKVKEGLVEEVERLKGVVGREGAL